MTKCVPAGRFLLPGCVLFACLASTPVLARADQTLLRKQPEPKAVRVIPGVSPLVATNSSKTGTGKTDTGTTGTGTTGSKARAATPAKETVGPASSGNEEAEVAGNAATEATIRHSVDASVDEMQPYMQVRVVQNLQAQTAKGSTQALNAQHKLIIHLNEHFLAIDPQVWHDEQNARAAVIHLLSGGHPAVGHRLLSLDPPAAIDPALLKGALAYIEGRKAKARSILQPIDPLTLPPTLGGQVALVQAILAMPDDLEAAQVSIDKARLLLPGSLVEEAALRRAVSVAAALNDPRMFQSYSLQYMRRFNNSIYNSDFRRRFAIAMRRFGESEDKHTFAELDSVITEFDLDARRSLYLLLSYSSLIAGNVTLSNEAAKAALPLTMDDSESQARSHLYLAGSMLHANTIEQSLQHLWKVKRGNLSARDRTLADKIAHVLNNIRAWPESSDPALGYSLSTTDAGKGEPGWQLGTLEHGKQALDKTDLFLSTAQQSSLR